MSRTDFFTIAHTLFIVIGIATGYFFLAKFGMAWSNFTSGITLVWPAAGLALFCCSYFRWQYVLAIFLGSFLATQLLQFNQLFNATPLVISLVFLMAAADTLQAFIVAKVNRRFFESHFDISILRILPYVVSVFMSCLLGCSLGTFVLRYLHIIPEDELFNSWLSWWMGDAAGMLLFTPLLLWIFRKPIRNNNSHARAFLLLSSVIGLSIFVMAAVNYLERNQTSKQQELSAHRFQAALENRLELSLRDMDVMNRFYYKIYPTENDFIELAKPLLQRSPWINQLVWLPSQNIKSKITDATYWSLALDERFQVNSVARFIDFIKAQPLNKQLFAETFSFNQNATVENFYLYYPVSACVNTQNENCFFRGWIIAGIDLDQWLDFAIKQLGKDPSTTLIEINGHEQSILLHYKDKHWQVGSKTTDVPILSGEVKQLLLETPWLLLNKSYQIRVYQIQPSIFLVSWFQLSALICCLLVVGLLLSYLYSQQKHFALIASNQRKLEEDIHLHTHSLRTTNECLLKEIAEKHNLIGALEIAKDSAQAATQSKSRFLANMSHEIRTPLNAVLGYAQLLIRDKDMGVKQQEKLSAILTSGHKLLDLINDILDLSKIESGQLNVKQDFFDLHQEMSTVITVVSNRARSKNLPLLIDIALPKPFIVKGDRQKLGQILINLLSNAIKFTHQGKIHIELSQTQLGVEFIISDTGSGIAEQELSELFVAFKQGIAGENVGGTGLGLILSRHLADAMGGNLQLQSQVGVGTKAILQLPLKEDSIHTQITDQFLEHSKSITLSQAVNVLVVEDDLASNHILVDLLKDVSCNVSSAFNGREGLAKATETLFDIIFTDIRMPDLNGLEMLHALRRDSNYFNTPIIAVSASSLEHERDYYLAQGFQDFIGKPYSFDEIFNALVKFAGAEYVDLESTEIPIIENTITDLTPIIDDLKLLLTFAAQGDMSKTKSQATNLTPETLGHQRHIQLNMALKNYDLEKVELLVGEWLNCHLENQN